MLTPRPLPLPRRIRRAACWSLAAAILGLIAGPAGSCAIHMPGRSHAGPLPALSITQASLADELRADVETLAGTIGERNIFNPGKLAAAETYLAEHQLPNEWDYFDPAKADEKRECGLHATWGGRAAAAPAEMGARSPEIENSAP